MRSNHGRHLSEAQARSSRPEPGMSATAFSSTRRVVHCGLSIIHGHYRTCYRTSENPGSLAIANITNTSYEIRRLASGGKQHLPNQELHTLRVVRYGNKQTISAAADPGDFFGNFLPFDTGPACQWHGRRRCGPISGVSST